MLETSIELFDPSDDSDGCETCGFSYDELRFSINYDWQPGERLYLASTSVGCTGGDSFGTDDVAEMQVWLRTLAKDYPHAKPEISALLDFLKLVAEPW